MERIMEEDKLFPEQKPKLDKSPARTRKPYRKPQLEMLGDLRTVTLGGSPGVGDSGGSFGVEYPKGYVPGKVLHNGSIRLPDGSTRLSNGKIIPPGKTP